MSLSVNIVEKIKVLDQVVAEKLHEYGEWLTEQERIERRKQELKSKAIKLYSLDVQGKLNEWIYSSGNYEPVTGDIIPLDMYIWAFDFETFYAIVKEFWLPDKLKYISDRYDCDDFALHFRTFLISEFGSNMAAYSQSTYHAFNTIILSDLRFMVFEPQNGIKWWKAGDSSFPQYYVPLRLMLW